MVGSPTGDTVAARAALISSKISMGKYMSVRNAVLSQVKQIAEQQRKTLQPLTDDLPLVGSGLDSLCIALVVANLEDELGIDPFSIGGDVALPETLGEFIEFYEKAA
jgi:hypothetical protein